MELIIAVGFFGVISGLVYFVLASRSPVSDEAIQRRLENIGIQAQSRAPIGCTITKRLRYGSAWPISFLATRRCPIDSVE